MEKVLIAHSLYPPHIIGGAEISTQILAQTMNRHYDVKVITVGGHEKREVRTEIINGIEISRLPYNNRYWIGNSVQETSAANKMMWRVQDIFNIKQYRYIKAYLARVQPAIIHTQNIPGLSLAIWKAAHELNIPVVHTLRDFSLIDPIKISAYSRLYRQISRRYSRMISSVIGISNHILGSHTTLGFFERSSKHVIHNIVEENNNVQELYAEKEIHHHQPLNIGYFGQLTEVKGVHYLIDAVKSLGQDIVGTLHIFGDGPLLQHLKQLVGSESRIIFRGKLDKSQISPQMKEMDLTVVPSTWAEPFGRVVIESYQVGTPVYASRVGGMAEILLDTDEFAFTSHSSESITQSILQYYHMSEQKKINLKKRCYQHSQLFNENYLLQKHMDIYEKLIRHGG
ncbi:glycosyltransferase [Paenibacillus taichungensis]|uniref:glycosyltransferase n=1 Tax=Paenibacillus taichungensis TaxID=484184 RepID=UPI003D9A2E98